MRKRLVLAVIALSLLFVSPADAQSELDQARADVAATTERLEEFLADLDATQRRGDVLASEYWQVQSGLEQLDVDVAASQASAAELAVEVDGLRDEVKLIAVDQYMSRSEDLGIGDHVSEADRAAAEALARIVVGVDNSAIDQLAVVNAEHDRVRTVLESQRSAQAEVLSEVEATQASIGEELDRLSLLRAAVDTELSELEAALEVLEEAELDRQAAAADQARIAEERHRAEEAAAVAARLARQIPTPAPTPEPTATPLPTATTVPNPQLGEATPTSVPNPQLPDSTGTAVPNPQLGEATPTSVPNPQPSEPLPTSAPAANPQPSVPVAPSGGGIVCPLAGPFTHTDDFSAPRAVGGVHRANDLISAQGTPVLAASSGTVDHRGSSVGGMSAHLKGDNGDYYFYTHLSGYENVGAGYVTAGTVIGYVGMTGNAPIPHLHFEIHKGGYGNYSNPYGPVRAACF
jgi:murein DD-endopeptidase MepM/ murein hydrolase activator NlpD